MGQNLLRKDDLTVIFNPVKDFSCNPLSPVLQTISMANSNAKVQLKTLDDGYCLVVDGEESESAEYGEPLEMETTDGRRFMAFVEANGSEVEAMTEFWAYEVLPVVDVPILEEDGDEDERTRTSRKPRVMRMRTTRMRTR